MSKAPEDGVRRERQVLESISDACFLLDRDWRCRYANGVASRMLGFSTENCVGRRLWDVVPELRGTGLEEHLRRCARTEEAAHFETYFAARDAFALAHCYPTEDGISLFLTDLTEARRNARLLRNTEERFEALADVTPVLLFGCDDQGSVDYVNHRFSSYTGLPPAELVDQGWREVLHPEDREALQEEWARAREEQRVLRQQCRLRSSDGPHRWFVVRARPLRDAEGVISRWFGCFTDIHQEKTLQQDLEESSRQKDLFLSMLAHELRNPLAPLRAAARVLESEPEDEEQRREMVEILQRQVRHMGRLLDDLLDVSRVERGKLRLTLEELDLCRAVERAVHDLRVLEGSESLHVECSLPDHPVPVLADPARLQQVLGNVLHNARKFGEGRPLEVSLVDEEERARIVVRDRGLGMDSATLARVFEPFQQGDQSLDRSSGGLGLGLALVRRLTEMHGGEARVDSDGPGLGTTVTLILPHADRGPSATGEESLMRL